MHTKTVRGPVIMTLPNGERWTTERDIQDHDDLRATPFGIVNFGFVKMSPIRYVRLA